MKRIIPFILFLISTTCVAESGAYRVEVIVFRNLDVMAEPDTTAKLRGFSHFPDLLPDREISNETGEPPETLPQDLARVLADEFPDDLKVIGERSSYMDDVWRRLRGSRAYRPLLWAAWQQNRVDYYPPMRVHDENLIDTQLRPPTNVLVAELTAADPLARYRSNFYQLDGSVQLRRSRFLHVYLDLEYRETYSPTVSDRGLDAGTYTVVDSRASNDNLTADAKGYELHSLVQNRQIQTGKLHYFDTPYFGALVFVTAISD